MKLNAIANLLKELANNEELEISLENGVTLDMAVEYCENEVALLEKKNATKSKSKAQKEKEELNEKLSNAILSSMEEGTKYQCNGLREICPDIADFTVVSVSKLTHILTELVKNEKLIREEIKGKPHFSLPTKEDNAEG